jgi:hypothetical protein
MHARALSCRYRGSWAGLAVCSVAMGLSSFAGWTAAVPWAEADPMSV